MVGRTSSALDLVHSSYWWGLPLVVEMTLHSWHPWSFSCGFGFGVFVGLYQTMNYIFHEPSNKLSSSNTSSCMLSRISIYPQHIHPKEFDCFLNSWFLVCSCVWLLHLQGHYIAFKSWLLKLWVLLLFTRLFDYEYGSSLIWFILLRLGL